jgi:subtilase family serine protease
MKSAIAVIPAIVCGLLLFPAARTSAQTSNVVSRIVQPVNDSQRTVLRGNTHPLARPEFDRGAAPSTLALDRMLLVLKRSPAQEAALARLLAEQQDRSSPNYHKWLTPVQFGQLFGASDQDVQKITSWLSSHGFVIDNVSNGRQLITFSGTAGQVEEAFHAPIHEFVVNGEQHWANANDPDIPEALVPVVAGVRSLHNFFPKPMHHARVSAPGRTAAGVKAQFTFPPKSGQCSVLESTTCFALGPTDFATIYNVAQVWNEGFDGSGVDIAVISDSNINISDVRDFRSIFGLPPNDPVTIVPPGSSDPGQPGPNGDEVEAVLDVEWSGAVAKGATINLIASKSTATTFGGDLSAAYVIDFPNASHTNTSTGLFPILSESFGDCELNLGNAGNMFYNTMWSQAAAEGITVLVSSGDNGAAGCDVQQVSGPPKQPAQNGLGVNGLASTPFNVAVGGTDFNDISSFCTYWNPCSGSANQPGTQASAVMYIPETTWNESCTNSNLITSFNSQFGSTAQDVCNNSQIATLGLVAPVGGSGGKSACITSNGGAASCSGGYPKPAFQNGVTPNADTTRDLPDISMFAGSGTISASFYVVCEADFPGLNGAACNLSAGDFVDAGGTSVSAQVFAGIMALVVEKNANSRQGNANTVLYALAGAENFADCNTNSPAAGCVFNDITTGTIAMPCTTGTLHCTTTAAGLQPLPPDTYWLRVHVLASLVCVLCIGAIAFGFRGSSRGWVRAMALLAVAALAANASGCGGGSGAGGGGGGGGGGVTPAIGVQSGYNAGVGYDLATGLGSVNVLNLVNSDSWAAVPAAPNFRPPVAPSRVQRIQDRDWQAAARAISITCIFCILILLFGFRRRHVSVRGQ